MPRSLVTGGAGFLGSHLCERLIEEGHEVICIDNLLTGALENLKTLREHKRFTFVHGDVTNPIEVEGPLDFVLNFASPASPKDYAQYPIHTLKVGALGTYQTLGLAKCKGAAFLLASSSEVYGDPEVNPQPESYRGNVSPVGPRSVYDEAKRYAEAIATAYHFEHKVRVRIARIFNTYGPGMRPNDGRALPNFMTQALRGEPLSVYGDGFQTRSFCYVTDMVDGLYRLLNSDESGPVNLGNPEEVGVLELAKEVIEVTGSKSQIVFQPLPIDDPRVRRPDIAKARQLLGWEPTVPRWEGLKLLAPYFSSCLGKSWRSAPEPISEAPSSVYQKAITP